MNIESIHLWTKLRKMYFIPYRLCQNPRTLLVLFFGGCGLNYRADFIRDVLKWKASISKVEVIGAACIRERYSIMMRHYNRACTVFLLTEVLLTCSLELLSIRLIRNIWTVLANQPLQEEDIGQRNRIIVFQTMYMFYFILDKRHL